MQKVMIVVVLLLVTAAMANADLLVNGDLDQQTGPGFTSLEFGIDLNDLRKPSETPAGPPSGSYAAYEQIYGWMGLTYFDEDLDEERPLGIEMQAFDDGVPFSPGGAHSGRLNVELDIGNVNNADGNFAGLGFNGGMYQDVVTQQASVHRLSFFYRGRPDYPADEVWQGEPFNYPGPPGETHPVDGPSTFAIGIYLDGLLVKTVDVGSSNIAPGATVAQKVLGDFEWEEFIFDFDLPVGSVRLEFRALGLADSYGGLIDTISLTAMPIPEPGTYALMGLGLVGIYFLRRRQVARTK